MLPKVGFEASLIFLLLSGVGVKKCLGVKGISGHALQRCCQMLVLVTIKSQDLICFIFSQRFYLRPNFLTCNNGFEFQGL